MKTASLDVREKAELPSAQARAILRAMELEWEAQQDTFAMKADFEIMRSAMKADFEIMRSETKADLAAVKSELVRWVFACILAQTAVLVGASYFVLTHLTK